MKSYRPWNLKQSLLMPPSLLDWLPENHLAWFVLDLMEQVDLSRVYASYEKELRGYPPYEPKMMMALLVYGYATGVVSSRKIEQKTVEDVAFRVIAGNQSPDHSRISEFRRRHGKVFEDLFVQVLRLCREAGLVTLGHVAIDGTKMKANASKHKAKSYERMKTDEEALRQQVKAIFEAAEAIDAEEDSKYGNRRGDELPKDFQRATTRLQKLQEAKKALESEARLAAEKKKNEDDDDDDDETPTQLPSHQVPHDEEGLPTPKAQRNFTDPDSRIMKAGKDYIQGYNAQAAVDSKHQIIVAQALTNQPPDTQHLPAVVEQIEENLNALPDKVSADAGYYSEKNTACLEAKGIDPFIATGRMKHGDSPPIVRGRPPDGQSPKERMARKLATKKGKEVYRMRKAIVEPVFGQIKAARGIRGFLRRGLKSVKQEWALICFTHNILKLFKAAQPAH